MRERFRRLSAGVLPMARSRGFCFQTGKLHPRVANNRPSAAWTRYLSLFPASVGDYDSRPCQEWTRGNRRLNHFKIDVLNVANVVIPKLKRFNAKDASDIAAMVPEGWVRHKKLIDRFLCLCQQPSTNLRGGECDCFKSCFYFKRFQQPKQTIPFRIPFF